VKSEGEKSQRKPKWDSVVSGSGRKGYEPVWASPAVKCTGQHAHATERVPLLAATADDGSRQLETDGSAGKLKRPRAGMAVAEARAPCPKTHREGIGSSAPKGPSSTVSFDSTWRASCSTCTTPRASACAEGRGERVPALPRARPARPRLRARRVRDLRRLRARRRACHAIVRESK
jgi:hypothetical protein